MQHLPRLCVPESHAIVFAASRQQLAVGAERHRQDFVGMSCEHELTGTSVDIPNPCSAIGAGGRDAFAVGAEGQARDVATVPLELDEARARSAISDLYLFVAGGGEARAVWAEGDAGPRVASFW